MEGTYPVMQGGQPIGSVEVRREGLYYRFRCRCCLTGTVICRLIVYCGGASENLGVLVPVDGEFGLETRLATKRLGNGKPDFRAEPKHSELRGTFVPLSPEEPFSYLSRLKDAYLVRREGQLGICFRESEKSG